MTQRDRVCRALQHAGPRGITQVDFLRTPTVDGGPPITRVAARVEELRAGGLRVENQGRRQSCVVYVLRPPVVSDEPARVQPSLGGLSVAVRDRPALGSSETAGPQCAIFDDWEAA